jgi:hypothetical protein
MDFYTMWRSLAEMTKNRSTSVHFSHYQIQGSLACSEGTTIWHVQTWILPEYSLIQCQTEEMGVLLPH